MLGSETNFRSENLYKCEFISDFLWMAIVGEHSYVPKDGHFFNIGQFLKLK